ncbi:MAG: hypothetical protein ABSG93_19360 [Solirubrobacteraceae bacterium]|jgi:hypothetical protein
MAPRKRKTKRPFTGTKIDLAALPRLHELTNLAAQGHSDDVDQMAVVSALVLYTTPEQLAGMLAAYHRLTAKLLAEEADDAPTGE